jgi:hypothetical protein
MLVGQVSANDLRAGVGRAKIDFHSLPAVLPIWVGKEASQNLGVEVAFAFEVGVEGPRVKPAFAMIAFKETFSNPLRLNSRRALSTIRFLTLSRWPLDTAWMAPS